MSGGALDYEALFDATPTPYLVLTPDLVIVGMNRAREAVTSTRREDIVGRDIFEVFTDDTTDATATGVQNLRASLQRVLATKRLDTMPVQRYALADLGTGTFSERWWSPVNVPVLDDTGDVVLLLHRVTDVTEWMSTRSREDAQPAPGLLECETELFARAHDLHTAWLKATDDVENYRRAMLNQRLIGQAVGMLMARLALDADRAFELLVRESQARNVKLHDVAQEHVQRQQATAGRRPPTGGRPASRPGAPPGQVRSWDGGAQRT